MNNIKLNTLIFLLTICCIWQISASEYFYYYKGEKIFLELNTAYIFVAGENSNNVKNVYSSTFKNPDLIEIYEDQTFNRLNKPTGIAQQYTKKYCREIALVDNLSEESYLEEINKLKEQNKDLNFAPYFKNGANEKIGLSHSLYLKLKNIDDFDVLFDVLVEYSLKLVGQNKFMPLWYTLEVLSSPDNTMNIANRLNETGLFACVEPTFSLNANIDDGMISNDKKVGPDDAYYPLQWYLNNTEENGVDINVEDAWEITSGSGINVAVFDGGIGNHPDLNANVVGDGYNAHLGTTPSIVIGAHGTAVAGIIGAVQDDKGITGVAPGCGLIPVSRKGSTFQIYADGINWSWQNGADVISNSWNSNTLKSCMIDDAISNALTKGRSALGTIVVFSSGNNNYNQVIYPASSNSLILCVGAIDRCGFRSGNATLTQTCDSWEKVSSSNYGSLLDVVAGGSSILTTDNTSDYSDYYGYNPPQYGDRENHPDLNYTYFGGTSAACPQVAGVAALVLSVNPNLTVKQVNDIIEQSAQKIRENNENDEDTYQYEYEPNRPNGKWNEEVGYGLVDAYEAVKLAMSSEYAYVCKTNIQILKNNNENNQILNSLDARYISSELIYTQFDEEKNNPDVIIQQNEAVNLMSNHITLNPGFKVESGGCLNATIEPCKQ